MFGFKKKVATMPGTVQQPKVSPACPLQAEPQPCPPDLPHNGVPMGTLRSTRALLDTIRGMSDPLPSEANDYLSAFSQPPETEDDPNLTADELFKTRINDKLHKGVSWGGVAAGEQFGGLTRVNLIGFIRFVEYWVHRGCSEGVFEARIDTIIAGLQTW